MGPCRACRARDARRDRDRPASPRRPHHAGGLLRPGWREDARVSRAFLSPSRCAEGTTTSPLRRALEGADPRAVRDLSLEGVVELRGNVAVVEAAAEIGRA